MQPGMDRSSCSEFVNADDWQSASVTLTKYKGQGHAGDKAPWGMLLWVTPKYHARLQQEAVNLLLSHGPLAQSVRAAAS